MGKKNSSRLKKNYVLLHSLHKAKGNEKNLILKKCNNELIKCFCDICFNICKGNCKLSSVQRKKLVRYKKFVRNLANKKKSLKSKRRQLVQEGGFLSALIGPAITVAASLLGNLLQKNG